MLKNHGKSMKKLNLIIAAFLLVVLFNGSVFANLKVVQIVVKGIISDEITGKPVEATVEFRTEDGKKFKNKSNSITGKFEQVFNAGDDVEVILSNWDIARKIVRLKVIDTASYAEQKIEYTVKKFIPGASVFQLNLFEPSSSTLLPEYKNIIETLKELMMFNRNVKFEFRVNSHDTYSKIKEIIQPPTPTLKQKAKKKSKKIEQEVEPVLQPTINIIEPDQAAIKTLVDARLNAISAITKELTRLAERIKTAPDYSAAEPQEQSSLSKNPDFEIVVTECKNPF